MARIGLFLEALDAGSKMVYTQTMVKKNLIEAYRQLGFQLHELAIEARSLHDQTYPKEMSYPWYGESAERIANAAQAANRMAAALEILPEREPSRDKGGSFRNLQSVALEQYVGEHGCSYADAVAAMLD